MRSLNSERAMRACANVHVASFNKHRVVQEARDLEARSDGGDGPTRDQSMGIRCQWKEDNT